MAKHFAIVSTGDTHKFCLQTLEQLGAQAWVYTDGLQMLEVSDLDGLIVCADRADAAGVLKEFFSAQKPVAVLGPAIGLAARVLGPSGVTLAWPSVVPAQNDGPLHYEECAPSDYVSDREHWLVSAPEAAGEGVKLALRELVEMA